MENQTNKTNNKFNLEKLEKEYERDNKMFVSGQTEICRADLQSMPKTYDTDTLSDDDMQSIADEVEDRMTTYREFASEGEISDGVLDVLLCDMLYMVAEMRGIPSVD